MSTHQSRQSPGVEYAKQEIQRRCSETSDLLAKDLDGYPSVDMYLAIKAKHTIEYFAGHLDEIYGKFEQQQSYIDQLEERILNVYRLYDPNQ